MNRHHWSLALGLFFLALALLTLMLWIPADIEPGILETERRRTNIGDAMAPTMIAIGVSIVSLWLVAEAWWKLRVERQPGGPDILDRESIRFMGLALGVCITGFLLMLWTGPLFVGLVNMTGAEIGSYRELRDTVPYKYLGFLSGGFVMIFGFISMVEHRLSWKLAGVSLAAAIVIASLFDLPFEDLLLPPNGDQ
jgi:hypothetical protein